MRKILVGVGTYNRNELLKKCLLSLGKLTVPTDCIIEIAISDNNPNKEAFSVYEECSKNISFKIHYEHEPEKSIAAVRNKVLDVALRENAAYIAFLDDDEYVDKEWIKELYNCLLENNADASTSYPQRICNGELQDIPLNITKRKYGSTRNVCATSSVLFSSKLIKECELRFDTNFGLMTGEDIDFFGRATKLGCKIVWCDKIVVFAELPEERKTLRWKMDRAFNNGYLKIFLNKKNNSPLTKKYYKMLFDLSIFALLTLLVSPVSQALKEKCILKFMDCFGKLKTIYNDTIYEHYKRD